MTATDAELDTKQGDVTVAGTKLSGLHDDLDGGDVEVLGFATLFTIGELLEVPASFIEAQAEEVGLSEKYLPRKPTPKKAYTRACNTLFWGNPTFRDFENYEVDAKRVNKALHTVQAEYYDGDAEEFRDTGALGNLSYDYDNQQLVTSQRTADEALVPLWNQVSRLARQRFDDMQQTYMGSDLRVMVRNVIGSKFSVPLRNAGAVYFVPASRADDLRKVSAVIDSCNTFKKPHRPRAQVAMIEVIDSEDKREFVEARVQEELSERVEKALGEAADRIDEEGSLTDEIEAQVEETLQTILGDTVSVAEEYNAMLRAEIEIEQMVDHLKGDFRNEVGAIAQEVVEEETNN